MNNRISESFLREMFADWFLFLYIPGFSLVEEHLICSVSSRRRISRLKRVIFFPIISVRALMTYRWQTSFQTSLKSLFWKERKRKGCEQFEESKNADLAVLLARRKECPSLPALNSLPFFQQELLKSHRHSMSSVGENEHEGQKRGLKNMKGLWRDAFRTLKKSTTSSSGSGDDEPRSVSKEKTSDDWIEREKGRISITIFN